MVDRADQGRLAHPGILDTEGQGMTDYSELVKKLRDLHRDPRPASAVWLFDNQLALYDAAAAIEALQAEVERLKADVDAAYAH